MNSGVFGHVWLDAAPVGGWIDTKDRLVDPSRRPQLWYTHTTTPISPVSLGFRDRSHLADHQSSLRNKSLRNSVSWGNVRSYRPPTGLTTAGLWWSRTPVHRSPIYLQWKQVICKFYFKSEPQKISKQLLTVTIHPSLKRNLENELNFSHTRIFVYLFVFSFDWCFISYSIMFQLYLSSQHGGWEKFDDALGKNARPSAGCCGLLADRTG